MNYSRILHTGITPFLLVCSASVVFAEASLTMTSTQTVLAELHLSPDTLVASGLDSNEASTVLSAVYSSMSESWNSYSTACTQLDQAIAEMSDIKKQLRSITVDDPSRAELESDRLTLEAQITALQQTREGLLDTFQLTATNNMNSEDREIFAIVSLNMDRAVPMAYRTLSLSEEQWAELKHALAVIKTNEEPPSAFTQLVSGYQSYEYHLAETQLQTNLVSVGNVFSDFLLSLDP